MEKKPKNIFSDYPLTVHHHPFRGNHVHATGVFQPGDDVYVCPPFGSVVHPSRAGDVCSVCYVESVNVKAVPGEDGRGETGADGQPLPDGPHFDPFEKCDKCGLVSYCSPKCKSLGAGAHAVNCATFLNVARASRQVTGSLSMLLLCTVIIESVDLPEEEREETRALEGVPQTNLEAFMRLQANKDKLEPEEIEEYEADAAILQKCSARASKYEASRVVDFFGRVACNCFRIENADLDLLGLALYPGASFFNHTCDPNTVYVFDGKSMVFRALRPISPGEEVTISYIRLVGGKTRRRAKLLSHYYFECTCDLCHRESDYAAWEGMLCMSCKKAELGVPTPPPAAGTTDKLTPSEVSDKLGSMAMVICPDPVPINPTPVPENLACPSCGAKEPIEQVRARVRRVLRKLHTLKLASGDDIDEEEEDLGDAEVLNVDEHDDGDQGQGEDSDGSDDDGWEDYDDDDDEDDDGEGEDPAAKAERWRRRRERQRRAITNALAAMEAEGMTPRHHYAYQINEHVRCFQDACTDRHGGGAFPDKEYIDATRNVVRHLAETVPEHECETALEREKLAEALLDRYEASGVCMGGLREAVELAEAARLSTKLTYGARHISVRRLDRLIERARTLLESAK